MSKYGKVPHDDFEGLLNLMGGQAKMNGELAMRAFMRGEFTLTPMAQKTKIAEAVSELFDETPALVTVTNNNTLDWKNILQLKLGLYVDGDIDKIIALTEDTVADDVVTMKPHIMKRKAYDKEITENLPKVYELSPINFCIMIATEIDKVMMGKKSDILSKGKWCLFYLFGFVVHVRWSSGGSYWYLSVWRRGGFEWKSGSVVYSCN